jgi:multidrug efflux pump subunit AcrA (membrane-fusion protein)
MSGWKRGCLIFAGVAAVGAALGTAGAINHGGRGDRPTAAKPPAPAPQPERRPAVSVTVAPVTFRPLQRSVDVVGTFCGQEEVLVTPEVDGRIVKVYHDLGDVVHVGDVLADIDPTDYRLAVEEARRALESELAKVGVAELPSGAFDVNQLPSVIRAQNVERNAARKLARTRQLHERRIIPQEELDQTETDYRVAVANMQQMVLDAQAVLAMARHKYALLQTALKHLKDARVVVPVPTTMPDDQRGKAEYSVAQRMVSEGEMARRGTTSGIFKLVIDQTLKFQAAVPERYVGEVKVGLGVQLQVEAYADRTFEGTVARVCPMVDRLSRTFEIEALVPNKSRELKAGGFAKAAILTRVDPQGKTVPVEALLTMVGVTKVFVVEKGAAHAVLVTPGVSGRGWVEVSGNLPAGSQVITSGHNNLAEGTLVTVHQADASAQAVSEYR